MSYETSVNVGADGIVDVRAYGGNRTSRGNKITAALRPLRKAGTPLERFHVSYDEAQGFMSMTWARYRVSTPAQRAEAERREHAEATCDVCGSPYPKPHAPGCSEA